MDEDQIVDPIDPIEAEEEKKLPEEGDLDPDLEGVEAELEGLEEEEEM